MPREIKDINLNAGYNNCNARMSILKNETVQRDLSNFNEISAEDVGIDTYIYVDNAGDASKIKLGEVINSDAIQADWLQDDDRKFDFIKNKEVVNNAIFLQEDMVSLYNIGGIHIGQIFEKGTSVLEIMKEMLSVSHPEVFRFGAIDELAVNPLQMEEIEISTADLISKGFTVELTLNNQYYAIAIPKSSNVVIDKVFQAGYALGIQKLDLDDAWDLYVDASGVKTTGTFTFEYKFKFKGQ